MTKISVVDDEPQIRRAPIRVTDAVGPDSVRQRPSLAPTSVTERWMAVEGDSEQVR